MGMNFNDTSAGSRVTYLNSYSGSLVLANTNKEKLITKLESLSIPTEGIRERKKAKGDNEGQVVYYVVVPEVEGVISNMKVKEADWGDTLEITIKDVEDSMVIDLGGVFDRTVKDFIRRLGNVDLTSELRFGLWKMTAEETGKSSRSGVKIYQNGGTKVEYALTYDDMPAPVEKKKGRETKWDYTDQEAFLYEYLQSYIKDNFSEGLTEPKAEEKVPESKVGGSDDMPF
jgi:hypothetical protein